MKLIIFLILFGSSAFAQEDCPPIPPESIAAITALQVPNCAQTDIVEQQARLSESIELRRQSNLPVPQGEQPVCGSCRTDFQARVTPTPFTTDQKKNAFFETAYKELEKSISSIALDITGLRNSWTTGSRFSQSLSACDTNKITQGLKACNSPYYENFKSKNLANRIGSEIAALITNNQTNIDGILNRPGDIKTCPISDIDSSNIRQYLLEESITPQMITQILSVEAQTPAQLQSRLATLLGPDKLVLMKDHPILRSLMLEPAAFFNTLRSLRSISDTQSLRRSFRAALYASGVGDTIDSSNARKCASAIESFTQGLCSPNFARGNISLGPFHNIKKYSETGDIQSSDSDVTTTDIDFRNNSVAFEFCEESTSAKLSLGDTLLAMNSWMPSDERNTNLRMYSAEKYRTTFGGKRELCRFHPASSCSEDSDACRLYNRYKQDQSRPEGRIAASSDSNVDRVLQALIGNPATISPRAKEVLIAEGIIPQANGQLVERPTVPERQPDYLANVANGTITPDNGSRTTVPPQPGNRTRQGGQQTAQQPQLAQPQGSSAAQPDQQTVVADEDDSIDEDEVERDLRERLRRATEQQNQPGSPVQQRDRQQRRTGSRTGSSDQNRLPASTPIIPGQVAPQAPVIAAAGAPAAPTTRDAALAPAAGQTLSQKQMNAALANMNGASGGGSADAGGAGGATSEGNGQQGSSTVALTISGDIRTNLQRMLTGTDTNAENLRELLRQQRPFVISLNNSVFDVEFVNGVFTVSPRARENSAIASTLQGVFNESGRNLPPSRSNTLRQLQQTVRN